MNVQVNGETREVAPASSVTELLRALGIEASASGIAVALNGAVVTRRRWAETALSEGDRLEIIRATQGG